VQEDRVGGPPTAFGIGRSKGCHTEPSSLLKLVEGLVDPRAFVQAGPLSANEVSNRRAVWKVALSDPFGQSSGGGDSGAQLGGISLPRVLLEEVGPGEGEAKGTLVDPCSASSIHGFRQVEEEGDAT
jgi:hypothetical protein